MSVKNAILTCIILRKRFPYGILACPFTKVIPRTDVILAAAFKNWPGGKESRHDKSNKGRGAAEKPEVSKGSRGIGNKKRDGEGKVRMQPRSLKDKLTVSPGWVLIPFKGLQRAPLDTFVFLLWHTHSLSPRRVSIPFLVPPGWNQHVPVQLPKVTSASAKDRSASPFEDWCPTYLGYSSNLSMLSVYLIVEQQKSRPESCSSTLERGFSHDTMTRFFIFICTIQLTCMYMFALISMHAYICMYIHRCSHTHTPPPSSLFCGRVLVNHIIVIKFISFRLEPCFIFDLSLHDLEVR